MPENVPDTETWRKFLGAQVGIDLDERYNILRNAENLFWQDRQAMKAGNFTGIRGIPNQTHTGPMKQATRPIKYVHCLTFPRRHSFVGNGKVSLPNPLAIGEIGGSIQERM